MHNHECHHDHHHHDEDHAGCGHSIFHSHDHHGHILEEIRSDAGLSKQTEKRLWWAVGANVLLTVGQVIGGIVSGSLALVADALHNFSDAASLFIALVAIRIGYKPADNMKTFGYKRAETIAALINLVSLIIIGLFLSYEAIMRFIAPEPIMGLVVMIVAGGALIVDSFTAFLTWRASKSSMNIHAAFLHNLVDAFASIAVIISGALIMAFGWVWIDAVMTLLIAGFVLWQGFTQIGRVIHLLMEGVPEHINVDEVIAALDNIEGLCDTHHVHIWAIDENRSAIEAHVVLDDLSKMEERKKAAKELLAQRFGIVHSTLEFEVKPCVDTKSADQAKCC